MWIYVKVTVFMAAERFDALSGHDLQLANKFICSCEKRQGTTLVVPYA